MRYPKALPTIKVTSALAQSLQVRLVKSRVQLRDMTRWLSFFVLGVVGLGLGIAYILTDLYRTQAFPEFMWLYHVTVHPSPLARGSVHYPGGGHHPARRAQLLPLGHLWPLAQAALLRNPGWPSG